MRGDFITFDYAFPLEKKESLSEIKYSIRLGVFIPKRLSRAYIEKRRLMRKNGMQ